MLQNDKDVGKSKPGRPPGGLAGHNHWLLANLSTAGLVALLLTLGLLIIHARSGPSTPPQIARKLATPTERVGPATATPEPTQSVPVETTTQPAPTGHSGRALPVERGRFFAASGACALCHTNMVDEAGADVSTDADWCSTMMANSARDVFWQATLRSEVLSSPDYQAAIEDKCATCHMPMARFTSVARGGQGQVLDAGYLSSEDELHTLAMDSVACTACHQIAAEGLGDPDSFSGGWVIDTELPMGERLGFGPYTVDEAQIAVMQGGSGFVPTQGPHLSESEMCATCHTLFTSVISPSGEIAGRFPEQTPYLEWLHSDYVETKSCQSCHMPAAQGGVQLSVTGGPPRSPFSQHIFVGGNTYMPQVLKTFASEMAVTASSDDFDATIERTLDQLQRRTATVRVENPNLSDARLSCDVVVENQAGHKFPSSYPARRAWLHFAVRDADGEVVFESGAVNPDGSIAGNVNDTDATAYEPHYQVIDQPDQVQIYETIIRNTTGDITTVLMHAAEYAKDNRVLPAGFDKGTAPAEIAAYGRALDDADFDGGGDRIHYVVGVGDAQGPFSVTAELLYQSISARWADNLRRHEAPEIVRFFEFREAVPLTAVTVARQEMKVE